MRGLQIRKWTILICGTLLLLLTGYIVSANLWISSDSGIRTGGEVYLSGKASDEEINVFENPSTVSGKTAVIAPGSKGSYTFTIENTKEFPIQITWGLSDENEKKIPMQYRLKTEDDYLVGSAKEWISGETLETYIIEDEIASGEQREYALDWEWPFEIDDSQNARDTELGNLAASGEEVKYSLHFSFRAEGEGGSDIENPEEPQEEPGQDEQPEIPPTDEKPEDENPTDEEPGNEKPADKEPTNGEQVDEEVTNKKSADEASDAANGEPADKESADKETTDEKVTENWQEYEYEPEQDKGDAGETDEKITVNAAAKEKADDAEIPWKKFMWLVIILPIILFIGRRIRMHFKTEEEVEKDR